jgi:hypothetical protein
MVDSPIIEASGGRGSAGDGNPHSVVGEGRITLRASKHQRGNVSLYKMKCAPEYAHLQGKRFLSDVGTLQHG